VDGSLDTSFNPGTGADNLVQIAAVQGDGKIIIGGSFSNYNGTIRKCITRLNLDGSLDLSFSPGSGSAGTVNTIAIQPDNKVVIGGYFNSYNGFACARIARLNATGNLDTGFNSGIGPNNTIRTTTIQSNGKIIIG